MRPDRSFRAAAGNAVRKGWLAAVSNLYSIVALEAAMAAIVGVYYLWPAGSIALSNYAEWQASGGDLGNGLVLALAGGVLSEISFVCFQQKGRWTKANVENLIFKFIIFFISGCIVREFYRMQTIWWGTGTDFRTLAIKVIVDQFGYTIIFSAPYYALLTRWQALRYSIARLWQEVRGDFLTKCLLPVLVMNWMFWIPAVTFVYLMPSVLQPPLAAFATAIWGLLITAIGNQDPAQPVVRNALPVAQPAMLPEPAE